MFFDNIVILGNSLRMEFLFFFFEVFTQHVSKEYLSPKNFITLQREKGREIFESFHFD